MGAPKKTDEYKKNYIKENLEVFIAKSKRNVEVVNGYESKEGDELKKIYLSVQGSIRRTKNKNNSKPKDETNNTSIELALIEQLKNIIEKSNSTEDVLEYQSKIEDLNQVCVEQLEKIMKNDIQAKEEEIQVLLDKINSLGGKKYKLVEEE